MKWEFFSMSTWGAGKETYPRKNQVHTALLQLTIAAPAPRPSPHPTPPPTHLQPPRLPHGLSPGPLTLTCLGLGSPICSQASLTGTTPRDAYSPGCSDRLRESQSDPLTLLPARVREKHVLFSTDSASGVNSARWKLPLLCPAEPNILRLPPCKKSWKTWNTWTSDSSVPPIPAVLGPSSALRCFRSALGCFRSESQ